MKFASQLATPGMQNLGGFKNDYLGRQRQENAR
jgi:hypothetical protein